MSMLKKRFSYNYNKHKLDMLLLFCTTITAFSHHNHYCYYHHIATLTKIEYRLVQAVDIHTEDKSE